MGAALGQFHEAQVVARLNDSIFMQHATQTLLTQVQLYLSQKYWFNVEA